MKTVLLGAGASLGFDETRKELDCPVGSYEFFTKGSKLGIYSPEKYPTLNDRLLELFSEKFGKSSQNMIKNLEIDSEEIMEWLVAKAQYSDDQSQGKKAFDARLAIGEMWYFIWDLLRYYSFSYRANSTNCYFKLARSFEREKFQVICLNYDLLFELAIMQAGLDFYYPLESLNVESVIPIVKIHGSINWLNSLVGIFGFPDMSYDKEKFRQQIYSMIYSNKMRLKPAQIISFADLKRLTVRRLIQSHLDCYEPLLIPPIGKFKDYYKVPIYVMTWQNAEKMLGNTSELIIIGSQLRRQDAQLRDAIQNHLPKGTGITIVGGVEKVKTALSEILSDGNYQITNTFSRFSAYTNTLQS